jgi:hypothetical protein
MRTSTAAKLVRGIVIFLAIAAVGGCSFLPWQRSRYVGPGSEVFFLSTGQERERDIAYTLKLGDDPVDVYFAFVNYSRSGSTRPIIGASWVPEHDPVNALPSAAGASGVALSTGQAVPLRDPPEVTSFNNDPPRADTLRSRAVYSAAPMQALLPGEFYSISPGFNPYTMSIIDTTLLHSETDENGVTVNVRLADDWDDYISGPAPLPITASMGQALAEAFLIPGVDNDIYDWVTTILGEPWYDWATDGQDEWAADGHSELISPLDVGNTIEILLLDIEEDGVPSGGVVVGLFWAKDNYYQSAITVSNERIMFYLDAPMFSQPEGGTWEITDYWPAIMVSTLAHEFQHMIHFYQKNVLRMDVGETETWLNELLSLAIEDVLSERMGVAGPRGVDPTVHSDGSAGDPDNPEGRIPEYNTSSDTGVFTWTSSYPLPNYAVNYAFGAYLTRQLGGPELLGAILHNDESGHYAITRGLEAMGFNMSTRRALSRWAGSVLVSDEILDPLTAELYRLGVNSGGWFLYTVDESTFNLGSIDYHNYRCDTCSQSGPIIFTSSPPGGNPFLEAGSATFFLAGESLTGTREWDISLGENTDLVVVVRPTGM